MLRLYPKNKAKRNVYKASINGAAADKKNIDKEMVKSFNVRVKTEIVFVESLTEHITNYAQKNIELSIADLIF